MRRIEVPLSTKGIEKLIQELEDYQRDIEKKANALVERLADEGMQIAQFYFDIAVYDGVNDVKVTWEKRGNASAAVIAAGNAVLFIEFGAGYLMGYGHPEPMGYGPGTYPGKGHWDDPNGWWLPKAVQEATGKKKSFGNPPAAAMYNTVKDLEERIAEIASEVFK